jgi:hypothetical protein
MGLSAFMGHIYCTKFRISHVLYLTSFYNLSKSRTLTPCQQHALFVTTVRDLHSNPKHHKNTRKTNEKVILSYINHSSSYVLKLMQL